MRWLRSLSMKLRFYEITESRHRILNPFTPEKLRLLGQICVDDGPARVLDLDRRYPGWGVFVLRSDRELDEQR